MSSYKFYINDLKRRIYAVNFINEYRFDKYLLNDLMLPFNLKIYVRKKMYTYNNKSVIRVRNRCIYTYRSRSVHSQFKLARSQLRENIWKLLIPGVSHASW